MYGEYTGLELEEMLGDLMHETSAENEAQQVIERIKTDVSNMPSPIYCFPLSAARSAIEVKGLAQLSVDELLQWLEELVFGTQVTERPQST